MDYVEDVISNKIPNKREKILCFLLIKRITKICEEGQPQDTCLKLWKTFNSS